LTGIKEFVEWDYNKPQEWHQHLDGKDVVIHLASVNLSSQRWNKKFKKLAYNSRIVSTENIIDSFNMIKGKPGTFICSSAVGYYGDRDDELLNEDSIPGNDFLAVLCKDWEKKASKAEMYGVRRVSVRTGVGFSKDESLLKKFKLQFNFYTGGPLGTGNQWFPWIHIDDIVGIYIHVIDNENITGPVNAASPGIIRMKDFADMFGKILHRPSYLKVPEFVLKIVAGELGEHATDSQRISVDKLINNGYKFKFENLEEALRDLLM